MADLNKKKLALVIRQIDAAKSRIAKERDKIVEHCDEAGEGLQAARDALSRLL